MDITFYIIGAVILVSIYAEYIKRNSHSSRLTQKENGKLSVPVSIQIILSSVICGTINSDFIYTIDNGIDSVYNGSLWGMLLGWLMPNLNYGASLLEILQRDTYIFLFLTLIFIIAYGYGVTHRKNRFILELMSIVTSICCLIAFFKIADLYQYIFDVKKGEGIIEQIGFSYYEAVLNYIVDNFKYVIPILFIIAHFVSHKALNEYYDGNETSTSEADTNQELKTRIISSVAAVLFLLFFSFFMFSPEEYITNSQDSGETTPIETSAQTTDDTNADTYAESDLTPAPAAKQEDSIVLLKQEHGKFHVSIHWPTYLDNPNTTQALQNLILSYAFDNNDSDIEHCISQYFQEMDKEASENEYPIEGYREVEIKKRIGNFLIIQIRKFIDLGGAGAAAIYNEKNLHFDCTSHSILTLDNIIYDAPAALRVVNQYIARDPNYLEAANELPKSFELSEEGIIFIFPQYSIGPGSLGEPHILVPYNDLMDTFTTTFKQYIR